MRIRPRPRTRLHPHISDFHPHGPKPESQMTSMYSCPPLLFHCNLWLKVSKQESPRSSALLFHNSVTRVTAFMLSSVGCLQPVMYGGVGGLDHSSSISAVRWIIHSGRKLLHSLVTGTTALNICRRWLRSRAPTATFQPRAVNGWLRRVGSSELETTSHHTKMAFLRWKGFFVAFLSATCDFVSVSE